jgi:hypothetical protein
MSTPFVVGRLGGTHPRVSWVEDEEQDRTGIEAGDGAPCTPFLIECFWALPARD